MVKPPGSLFSFSLKAGSQGLVFFKLHLCTCVALCHTSSGTRPAGKYRWRKGAILPLALFPPSFFYKAIAVVLTVSAFIPFPLPS